MPFYCVAPIFRDPVFHAMGVLVYLILGAIVLLIAVAQIVVRARLTIMHEAA